MAFISINAETADYLEEVVRQVKDGNSSGHLDANNNWGIQGEFKPEDPFAELTNGDLARLHTLVGRMFDLMDPEVLDLHREGVPQIWNLPRHEYLRGQLELTLDFLGIESNEFTKDALLAKVCE